MEEETQEKECLKFKNWKGKTKVDEDEAGRQWQRTRDGRSGAVGELGAEAIFKADI